MRNCKTLRTIAATLCVLLVGSLCAGLSGCNKKTSDGKTRVELLHYKMEAVDYFDSLAEKFNAENEDVELIISSPNEAMTILKTRLIRNDPPDMIGIGGDINFSYLLDSDMLMDISDYAGIAKVKPSYMNITKELEFVPKPGLYSVPYVANAAGVLYNREIFEKNGWNPPTTWSEFMALCTEMQAKEIAPLTLGYKDTWTCLAPWNALSVGLTDPALFDRVNLGEDSFQNAYAPVAERQRALLQYCGNDPFSYGYNDACTAFARGQAAMYPIGSYAIAQILSVNPDLKIGSFVMPTNEDAQENVLNSGIDLQFCVMQSSEKKEACYRVLEFLQQEANVQSYITAQMAVPCQEGDFVLSEYIEGMKPYLDEGRLVDYPDHHYPGEMGVDAKIQTYLITGDKESFLSWFDAQWVRTNRDIIAKQKAYAEKHGSLDA